jgi:DNA gyrase inhibitor GyrI
MKQVKFSHNDVDQYEKLFNELLFDSVKTIKDKVIFENYDPA